MAGSVSWQYEVCTIVQWSYKHQNRVWLMVPSQCVSMLLREIFNIHEWLNWCNTFIWISSSYRTTWCFLACSWSWWVSALSAVSTQSKSSHCAFKTRNSPHCFLKSGMSMSETPIPWDKLKHFGHLKLTWKWQCISQAPQLSFLLIEQTPGTFCEIGGLDRKSVV